MTIVPYDSGKPYWDRPWYETSPWVYSTPWKVDFPSSSESTTAVMTNTAGDRVEYEYENPTTPHIY